MLTDMKTKLERDEAVATAHGSSRWTAELRRPTASSTGQASDAIMVAKEFVLSLARLGEVADQTAAARVPVIITTGPLMSRFWQLIVDVAVSAHDVGHEESGTVGESMLSEDSLPRSLVEKIERYVQGDSGRGFGPVPRDLADYVLQLATLIQAGGGRPIVTGLRDGGLSITARFPSGDKVFAEVHPDDFIEVAELMNDGTIQPIDVSTRNELAVLMNRRLA